MTAGPPIGSSLPPLQGGVPTRTDIFGDVFLVFLGLGTLVGIVVVSYTLYNAYKYRDGGVAADGGDGNRPELGELPKGDQSGKGKKLFLSFGISAIIVISLVVFAFGALMDVEQPPEVEGDERMDVHVEGYQFGWDFTYEDEGVRTTGVLVVPADTVIHLEVTGRNVWHNFGIPELRVKSDAIPGQTSRTWFAADETGTYTAECFELCGVGHSGMEAEVVVVEPGEFDDRLAQAVEESGEVLDEADDASDETDDANDGANDANDANDEATHDGDGDHE